MMQPGPAASEIPQAVRIRLLSGFSVSVGSRNISQDEWRSKKAAALVKLLALAPGHRMHREQAMDLLWPDAATRAASNNLRQVVYGARKVLDPASGSRERYLSLKDEQLILCPEGRLWLDVDAFEGAAATARRSRGSATYRAAIDLYAGELLPGDRYEGWAEGRRNELRRLYLALLVEVAGLYEGREEYAMAIEALRKATAKEPTLEEAHVSLMRLHALSGRPERALAQYERLREALQKDIGTRPTETTRRLRDEIAAGRLRPTPPAGPLHVEELSNRGNHNLPAPRTSFVGREQELLEVKRALAMSRLLTLTGAGGTGKTRLSMEVARDLVGSYPDGVWFVELAPITEPGLVAQEVASTLGVQEHTGEPLTDTLIQTLASKVMLLVLDNCEHVVEVAARLADTLLASCSRLKVLATSREPLAVTGEVNWTVPPLSLPDASNGGPTPEALMSYEAVRLFADRARLRLLDFEVTRENAGAVARVCRKLDGIPLAIELATARMGALAVDQVAQRLDVSLDVLKGTSRSASPRQQTLRATLDWSHDLLSKDERVFFRRLSAFAGGWTLEAAEAVCSGDDIEREDVLDLLGGLVDKSLVVVGQHTGGAVRYGMLELIRQYAREKLRDCGEAEAILHRHAKFFLGLAEEGELELSKARQAAWLERLEIEHDNLRVALSWTLKSGEVELGLWMGGALGQFWYMRGHTHEGRRWLEEALVQDGQVSAAARAKALDAVSWAAYGHGDLDRAVVAAEQGLKLITEAGAKGGIAASFLRMLGTAAASRGDFERAVELLEESLVLSHEAGDMRRLTNTLLTLASVSSYRGDRERAIRLYEEGMTLCRRSDNMAGLAQYMTDLGHEFLLQGNHERATVLIEEAGVLLRKQGNKGGLQYSLDNLGWAMLLRGDQEEAKASYEESLRLCRELSTKTVAAESIDGLSCVAADRGEAERAARLFGAAQALHEAAGYQLPPQEHALREPYLTAARSRLDEAAWEAAFAEGQAMTFEEAVEYALHEEDVIQAGAVDGSGASDDQPLIVLTSREREIATLVARGLTNRQISTELGISERTAGNHVARILRKLGLSSRAQIGALVVEDRPNAPPQE